LNEIAPINKVIPLGLAVQAPLKGKMIHNPNNLFWRFSWVVPYSFIFVFDPTLVRFVSCLASKRHLGSNREKVDPFSVSTLANWSADKISRGHKGHCTLACLCE